ncbi:MAG: nicotinate-nicotinamide nucleotide adenylyltransferase, partial [Chloroflexota bacterium]|nr:nicotinate-nicotinamide nucleotide adenylyltransferase [Chloroflexota bacterium]
DKFFVILGDDNIKSIKEWKKYNELCSLVDFIVAPREKYKVEKNNFKYIQAAPVDLSSSKIRKNIKMKKEWDNLVPETVKEYIKKNNLYQ